MTSSGGSTGGGPPYFETKLRPEGLKKNIFGDQPPLLSKGLDDPPTTTLSQGLDLVLTSAQN